MGEHRCAIREFGTQTLAIEHIFPEDERDPFIADGFLPRDECMIDA